MDQGTIDPAELERAREHLERPSFAARLADHLGRPLEALVRQLPDPARKALQSTVRAALSRALKVALRTFPSETHAPVDPGSALAGRRREERWTRLFVASSGAAGGAFGLAGLAVELPVTTTLMLRSIAAIARQEGHDLTQPEVRVACLEVFALGGPSRADDAAETGYYAVRTVLARAVNEATTYLAAKKAISSSAPPLVRLLSAVSARFGVIVSQRAALTVVPVVGAVSGAVVNDLFLRHFQDVARGHFVLRRLERLHGVDAVRAAYEALPRR